MPLIDFSTYGAANLSFTINFSKDNAVVITDTWSSSEFIDKGGSVCKKELKGVINTSRKLH